MQGFGKKYRKPSGARMIFSTNPKGLALLVREEHELPLPVVMGDSATVCLFFPICFYSVRLQPFIWPFQKEMLSLQVR